jgi:hypothetical protein
MMNLPRVLSRCRDLSTSSLETLSIQPGKGNRSHQEPTDAAGAHRSRHRATRSREVHQRGTAVAEERPNVMGRFGEGSYAPSKS